MKICSKCKREKELSEFPNNKKRKDGKGGHCNECHKSYSKKHYNENKKDYIDRSILSRRKTKEYITSVKKNSVCAICGDDRWWVLDFHHHEDKINDISHMSNSGIGVVKREISKCETICANCHRDLHYQNRLKATKNKLRI